MFSMVTCAVESKAALLIPGRLHLSGHAPINDSEHALVAATGSVDGGQSFSLL